MESILKERRQQLGLTMLQVAQAVGVSEATVSRWESGDIANMRRDKIAKLANALIASIDLVIASGLINIAYKENLAIPSPNLGSFVPKSSTSLSPVKTLTHPPEFGILSAASANATTLLAASLTHLESTLATTNENVDKPLPRAGN